MENLLYADRRGTNCNKWDGQSEMFGEEGLHAMWVADMDFQVPLSVKQALHAYVEQGVIGYYKVPDAYYEAFLNWEQTHHGYQAKKEWLRFSPGVVAAFNWIIQFMTEPGDGVIVTTPVYYPFLYAAKNNNRKLITVDLLNHHGEYTIPFEAFEEKIIETKPALFILCSPHNPVGRVWKKEELEKLFDICKRHHVFVISDEIHQDLIFGENKHIPSYLAGADPSMCISITAPSKTFNLAGAQNSIVIIPDEALRQKWDTYTQGIRVTGGNAFGYVAAQAAYEGGGNWLEAVKKQIAENYEYVKEALGKHLPKAVVSPLEGTYLCWIDLAAYLSPDKMKETIQGKCRLAVDYGDWFGGNQFGSFIRMNLATSLENVKIGITALVEHL